MSLFSKTSSETESSEQARVPTFALVGNPNVGKSTLHNALTGSRQKVGNYSGVTVDYASGRMFSQHGKPLTLLDLPGAYSLRPNSPDEQITYRGCMGELEDAPEPDAFVCVVDASDLERHLFLLTQLLELGKPVILALNKFDVALAKDIIIDTGRLEKELGVLAIPTQANSPKGFIELKLAMSRTDLPKPKPLKDIYPQSVSAETLKHQAEIIQDGSTDLISARKQAQQTFRTEQERLTPQERSTVIQRRHLAIRNLTRQIVGRTQCNAHDCYRDALDKFCLNPLSGWSLLFVLMATLFYSIFSLSQFPMSWIESGFDIFDSWTLSALNPGPLRDLLSQGLISGLSSVLVFLPQIFILFFFMGILESCGYLPRAVCLLDGFMRRFGLSGKAFIPLMSSYACAIPGILATRTMPSRRERLATIFIAPWMSCSARLPVYLLMITMLFGAGASPLTQALVLLGAYAIGTLCALVLSWTMRKTLLKEPPKPSGMVELPSFALPKWRTIFSHACDQCWHFLKRAGTIILAFSIVIWYLSSHSATGPEGDSPVTLEASYIGQLGKSIEPALQPLGYDWRTGVALISSFAARELFVSTLAIINGVDADYGSEEILGARFTEENAFSPASCMSLIVFFIFAMQCMSTLVIVFKETGSWLWPTTQWIFMTAFAYLAAWFTYSLAQTFLS